MVYSSRTSGEMKTFSSAKSSVDICDTESTILGSVLGILDFPGVACFSSRPSREDAAVDFVAVTFGVGFEFSVSCNSCTFKKDSTVCRHCCSSAITASSGAAVSERRKASDFSLMSTRDVVMSGVEDNSLLEKCNGLMNGESDADN